MKDRSLVVRAGYALLATLTLASMHVAAQDNTGQPRRYALIIGIDKYRDTTVMPLRYAVSDAKSMKQALEDQGYEIKGVLLDEDATSAAIYKGLEGVRDLLRPEDVFVLYFAGHGMRGPLSGHAYWLNHETERSRPEISSLRVRDVVEAVARMKARRKLLILDHCYAGDIDASADYTVTRALETTERELKLGDSGDGPQLPPNNITFNMAAARDVAYENVSQHGLMTYALLEALQEQAQGVGETWSFHDLAVRIEERVIREASLRSIGQSPVFPTFGSRNTTDTKWTPFLRSISDANADVEARRGKLRLYVNQGRLSTDAQSELENLMVRLHNPPAEGATQEDRSAFTAMRWIFASGADEPDIAYALNQLGESLIR